MRIVKTLGVLVGFQVGVLTPIVGAAEPLLSENSEQAHFQVSLVA